MDYNTYCSLDIALLNLNESTYVMLEDISPNTIKTFIQIEDKNFYNHSGFDIF